MTATLLVFLKHPTPGKVKTRLAAVLGEQAAADLYAGWIGMVLEQLQPRRNQVQLVSCYTGGVLADFRPWLPLADQWWPQGEGDLGERLAASFHRAHQDGKPVLAIGTDCLEIEPELVMEALTALKTHDAVFGPATDGGYYLVGSARQLVGFFTGIRWSAPQTLADSLAHCQSHNWKVHLLPPRQDIDTWADWQEYCRRCCPKGFPAC
jgi:hypothetical protein